MKRPAFAWTLSTARRWPRAAPGRGLSLVELLVSLTLGLFVVGAGVSMFSSTRAVNNTSDNLSRVADTLRTSFDQLVREVREAGATPCDSRQETQNILTAAQGAAPSWWAIWDEPLRGYDDATVFPGAAIGTAVGERVNGTDAVAVRYGATIDGVWVSAHNGATRIITTNVNNHGIAAGEQLMLCTYRQASIFQATAVDTTTGTIAHAYGSGNCSGGLGAPVICGPTGTGLEYPAGAPFGRFVGAGWYVGNNGRPETGGRSLYRVTRNGAEEVAEGVNDLQLSYLVQGGTDYVAASVVTDWSQVVAVRFDVTFLSPDVGAGTSGTGQRLWRTVGFNASLRNLQP